MTKNSENIFFVFGFTSKIRQRPTRFSTLKWPFEIPKFAVDQNQVAWNDFLYRLKKETDNYPIFSRRFSWKEPAIVMAFRQCFLNFFLDTPEVTKIVLQNFKLPLLAQGTEPKRFPA